MKPKQKVTEEQVEARRAVRASRPPLRYSRHLVGSFTCFCGNKITPEDPTTPAPCTVCGRSWIQAPS